METKWKLFIASAVTGVIGGYLYDMVTILSFTANLGLIFALAGCTGLGYFMAMPDEKKE